MATRKKRLPAPRQIKSLEDTYAREVARLLTPARTIIKALRARERTRPDLRSDALSDEMLFQEVAEWIARAIEPAQIRKVAARHFKRVKKQTDPTFQTWLDLMTARRVGVDPEIAISQQRTLADLAAQARIEENVALVEGAMREMSAELARELQDAISLGQRPDAIVSIFEHRLGVSESRLKLIARDQTSKAQGELSKIRQEALGISRYVWSTSGDERVRASHRALDGQVFSWDNPPPEGHPGEPIACRCVATPLIDD